MDKNEILMLKKVEELMNRGINHADMVDYVEEDLFEYLNLLESYFIHDKRYDADREVALAKDDVEVDPELVKERLAGVKGIDKKDFYAFIENRLKLHG